MPVFFFLILNSPYCLTLPAEVGLWVALNVVQAGHMFLKVGKNVLPSGASYLNLPMRKWSGISGSPPAARIWLYKSSVMPLSLLISYYKFVTKSFMPSQLWQSFACSLAFAIAAWCAVYSSFCYCCSAIAFTLVIPEILPPEQLSDSLPAPWSTIVFLSSNVFCCDGTLNTTIQSKV